MIFSRHWAMPNSETFSIPPIEAFVRRYLVNAAVSVDPFARNKRWATFTNDLNPATSAEFHLHAVKFLQMLAQRGIRCNLALLDPPYSPRQISECYRESGLTASQQDTQNAKLYAETKAALTPILEDGATVLSFGWNSAGMGKKHGFEIIEVMLVCHGAAHNDTICLAERRAVAESRAPVPFDL